MKIHLWAPGFTVFQGGIGAFSRHLAVGLQANGHDVSLYGRYDQSGTWSTLPLWGAGRSPAKLQIPYFAAGLLRACAVNRPDYLVSTHLNFGPIARLCKSTLGTRYALVVHGIDVHHNLSRARRSALRAADLLIAVSSWTRRRLLATLSGLDPERVVILPNAIDERRFSVGDKNGELVERYALKPDEKVVLTVARMAAHEGYKGYDRVIQALPAVQVACGPVRYLLVGHGNDRPRLEAMIQSMRLGKTVTFAGFVPDEEIVDHPRLGDAFAMPSTGEGFGITFLEALACGTPVLAGNVDGSVDAVAGGRLGCLVDPTDVRCIARGLIDLLRRRGPKLWFNPQALHKAVSLQFGQDAFRRRLQAIFKDTR